MKIHEVMTRGIETVSSAATLEAAGKIMQNRNIGFLPVVDSEKLEGVVTDRDIVLRAVAAGLRPAMTTVRQVMTKQALTVYDDQTLTDASLVMEKNLVHRLVDSDIFDVAIGACGSRTDVRQASAGTAGAGCGGCARNHLHVRECAETAHPLRERGDPAALRFEAGGD